MTRRDADLLVRLRDGDVAAFDEIVARYERRLIGYFHALCGDAQLAEDCAQEVFVRVYRARESYSPDASLATYLFRIARNYWIDVYRSRKVRPKERSLEAPQAALDDDDDGGLVDVLPADAAPPDAALAHGEDLARLQAALARLPEIQRSVLALAGGQSMRYEEISPVLGIPVGTVKSRVHAAVQNLRRLMGVTETERGHGPR